MLFSRFLRYANCSAVPLFWWTFWRYRNLLRPTMEGERECGSIHFPWGKLRGFPRDSEIHLRGRSETIWGARCSSVCRIALSMES
jgi:hypothetical protein